MHTDDSRPEQVTLRLRPACHRIGFFRHQCYCELGLVDKPDACSQQLQTLFQFDWKQFVVLHCQHVSICNAYSWSNCYPSFCYDVSVSNAQQSFGDGVVWLCDCLTLHKQVQWQITPLQKSCHTWHAACFRHACNTIILINRSSAELHIHAASMCWGHMKALLDCCVG